MKIRTQFSLLLAGIILIPLIVFGSILMTEHYRSSERVFVPSYRTISWPEDTNVTKCDWNRIRDFVSRLPSDIDVAVVDSSGGVLYSSISEIQEASVFSDDSLSALLDRDTDHVYQIDSHFNTDTNSPIMIVSRLLKENRYKPDRRVRYLVIISVVLACFLVLCTVAVALIMWSVTRSVSFLERETRRMSAGNLDVEIKVKGNNEVTSLTKSLNNMRMALRDAQFRRSRFIMGISHDLRTPISLIKGYAEALADGVADSPESREKSLEIIGSKIDQLEDMIDDLINYVRLDAGEWRIHLDLIPLKPVLSSYAQRIHSDGSLLNRNVTTEICLPDSLAVPLDENLFLRMLENLCGNALRYTREGGEVRLSAGISHDTDELDDSAEYVWIAVADNGCGIAEQDIPFVFDPFYRGSNSRREDGKGLGLSVVKTLADAFKWSVSVKSQKDVGSTFTIRIPL